MKKLIILLFSLCFIVACNRSGDVVSYYTYELAVKAIQAGDTAKFHEHASEFKRRYPQDSANYTLDSLITKFRTERKEYLANLEEKSNNAQEYLSKLKKDVDDIAGVTWYYQKRFTHYNNVNRTSLYIGSDTRTDWLRLKMSYEGDDWIFFEDALLSYDGNTWNVPFNQYEDKKSDHDTRVWEWLDVQVMASDIKFLRELAQSSSAKMRLTGKYAKTRDLTNKEKQGILEVLDGYEALKAKRNLEKMKES